MCGIAGYYNYTNLCESNLEEISKMIALQNHRGPNDTGIVGINMKENESYELDKGINRKVTGLFGFSRLSIRDISVNGHQPMRSNDGKVIISFNGEIYNADEYIDELVSDGVKLKGTSDTEILLNLYLKYGIQKTCGLLNGMFAISICDLRIRRMFLIRDRMGIKPLYYVITKKRFAYASEMKSFLALRDFERKIDKKALNENLTFFKPLNNILFEGVKQVEPGEYLVVKLDDFDIYKERYFDIDKYERPNKSNKNFEQLKKEGKEQLFRCVERQKVSDAKIGCQLSGGIDSSVVSYYGKQSGINDLNDSISVIFDGKEIDYSEEKYVDVVKDKLKIDAHKIIIDEDYTLRNYEKALWHSDTVLGRPNSIGLMLLTSEAKKYVTVLLSGEGADELLGGYNMFAQGVEIRKALKHKKHISVETVKGQPETVKSFAEYAIIAQQKTNGSMCKQLFSEYQEKEILTERIDTFNCLHGSDFDKQIKYALKTYLPELLLCQDKMSMANSIENRVPILDNDFVDFAFSIPEEHLLREKAGVIQGKFLLKEICADLFGEEFAYRRKMGFGLPYYRYFQNKRFKEYFYDIIIPGTRNRGMFNEKILENWYSELNVKTWAESELFWKACSFEAWAQMFLDGRNYITI